MALCKNHRSGGMKRADRLKAITQRPVVTKYEELSWAVTSCPVRYEHRPAWRRPIKRGRRRNIERPARLPSSLENVKLFEMA